MNKADRQTAILGVLDERASATVQELAAVLDVSGMTVRRDLEEMAARSELVRVHGGAHRAGGDRPSMLRREYSHAEKREKHMREKRAVARRAISLIEPDSTVFLGTGTTVEQMACQLPDCHLRIVTNSLAVFSLIEPKPLYELCVVGGMFRARTGALVGPIAEEGIDRLGLDIAFVGANGVCGNDVSTSNMEEGHFQQMALDKADARYVVLDASKIGRRDFFNFYELSRLDALVCDESITDEQRAAVEEYADVLL